MNNMTKSSAKPFSKQEKWQQISETREKFSLQVGSVKFKQKFPDTDKTLTFPTVSFAK